MGKRGSSQKKKGTETPSKRKLHAKPDAVEDDMDDEVDAFIKQRDFVSLDVNEDGRDSDEDDEQTVFDLKNVDDEDEEEDDDTRDNGFTAKLVRTGKYLRAKFGGVNDEMVDDEDEDEEKEKPVWGGRRPNYHGGDNRDFEEKSSDDDSADEEEKEAARIQREKAKSRTEEDFGIDLNSEDEDNRELTFGENSVRGKSEKKSPAEIEAPDEMGTAFEEVKKDLNALPKEEQLSVLNNSAPELVGLLAELNDALEELDNRVNPILSKVRRGEVVMEGGLRYLEVKQLLLLAYSQAITFYLLLKSEGQQVRDHPVLARLVEIKSLLDKMKQLDENLPSDLEEIVNKYNGVEAVLKSVKENATGYKPQVISLELKELAVSHDLEKVEPPKNDKTGKRKHQDDEVGLQSMKMLKVRAALEEKLKQKGIFGSITPRTNKPLKHMKPLNGKLESYDDFDDDPVHAEGTNQGHASSLSASKVSRHVAANRNKSKIISGDDDLPQRDDIGERRRKHELRVLAGAGIKSEDDAGDNDSSDDEDGEMEDSDEDSDTDIYEKVKQTRSAKQAAKAENHSRSSLVPAFPETVDGKRHITYQMEKNRGLTRARKKLIKNPRKKYKLKHQKQVKNRKGQVREIRKSDGPYGGEKTGINPGVSRSIRLQH